MFQLLPLTLECAARVGLLAAMHFLGLDLEETAGMHDLHVAAHKRSLFTHCCLSILTLWPLSVAASCSRSDAVNVILTLQLKLQSS